MSSQESQQPRVYRYWNAILQMRKSNPALALALAVTDLTSTRGQELIKAFPDYFCSKKRPSRNIPFSWFAYVAKWNAKNDPEPLLNKEEAILHLVTWGAIDHFNIPYVTLSHEGSGLPPELMGISLRPFSEFIYSGKTYIILEDSADEIWIAEMHYFKHIPNPFSCSHNDLCPL